MKKKNILVVLLIVFAISMFASCSVNVVFNEGDKTLGEGYSPDRVHFVDIDDEVNLDGVLNESFWNNSNALYYESTGDGIYAQKGEAYKGYKDGSVSIKTYFSDYGLYFGAVVRDPVIYKTKATAKKYMESGLEIYVAAEGSALADAKAVWLQPNGVATFGEYRVYGGTSGYWQTTAKGLDIAVKIDGEGLNSENNESYTIEAVLSWADLGLEGKPESIRVNPNIIRVREIPYENTQPVYFFEKIGESFGVSYAKPESWLKFTESGYVDRTVSRYAVTASAEKLSDENGIYASSIPEKSVAEDKNEKRGFSYAAVLKEDGLYVFGEARHNYLNTSQSKYDKTTYFGVTVAKSDKTNYQMIIFPYSFSGFDNAKFTVEEKDKSTFGYKYQTYWEGFVSYDTLSLNGVSLAENPADGTVYIGAEFTSNSLKNGVSAAESDAMLLKGLTCITESDGTTVRAEKDYWTSAPYGANLSNSSCNGVLSSAIVKIPVTKDGMKGFDRYDDSRFEGKPVATKTDADGKRALSYQAYYEKGVGIWVKAEAHHNTWKMNGTVSQLTDATHFEIQLAGKQAFITKIWNIGTSVGFDLHKSAVWTVRNVDGADTVYSTYLVGLISEEWMLSVGITQSDLNKGEFDFVGAFSASMKGDEKSTITTSGNPNIWWTVGLKKVGENGFSDN